MFSLQVPAWLHLLSELVKTEFGIGDCKERRPLGRRFIFKIYDEHVVAHQAGERGTPPSTLFSCESLRQTKVTVQIKGSYLKHQHTRQMH